MKHSNSHAVTKEKRKKFSLKAFFKKVKERRIERLKPAKPRGITVVGDAFKYADYIPYTGIWNYRKHLHAMPQQQSKRRKIARQTNRY